MCYYKRTSHLLHLFTISFTYMAFLRMRVFYDEFNGSYYIIFYNHNTYIILLLYLIIYSYCECHSFIDIIESWDHYILLFVTFIMILLLLNCTT